MGKLNFNHFGYTIEKTFKEKNTDKRAKSPWKKVTYKVRTNLAIPGTSNTQAAFFNWSEFENDSKRIKHNTKKYSEDTIREAFEKAYGIKIDITPELENLINKAPTELHVGDNVELLINNISKDGVVFDTMNLKQLVNSSVNLNKFKKFKTSTPKELVKCKVITASPTKITVDPLTPMLESWLNPILNNPVKQKVIDHPQVIQVKNLRLTSGGFVGKAVIPNISEWVGEDYTIDAFIPGSQIVLNIEDDFEKWNGKTVNAFVTSYIPKPGTLNQMSLICSCKDYLKFIGEMNIIEIFKVWCDTDKTWEEFSKQPYVGKVTGVINSSKKCGVFVEIPQLSVTGFVTTSPEDLGKYPPKTTVNVCFAGIEEDVRYDDVTGQMIHSTPYIIEDGILKSCSIKPVLKFVE